MVALAGLAVCVVALGGGLFHQQGFWMDHWQHKLFKGLCHQNPDRSFVISGTPMAVCSRCLGIYSAFTMAWLMVPVVPEMIKKIKGSIKPALIAVIIINLTDVFGNILGLWENTLLSRYLMGSLLGVGTVFLLGFQFVKNLQQTGK